MHGYHDLYAHLCHVNKDEQELPNGINYEQMMHWYLEQLGVIVNQIPGEFWFLRLRIGKGRAR
jgi:hypothetical protein